MSPSPRSADDDVAVSVRDSGRGVPADQLPHVFERFYRGDASRATEGSGLGLAIARLIVEAHGGSITIASREGRHDVPHHAARGSSRRPFETRAPGTAGVRLRLSR